MNFRNRKLLDLARGMACMNCGAEDGSTVPAHSNLGRHGKGMGMKAHDCYWAALCHRCHAWLDQSGKSVDPTGLWAPMADDKVEMFRVAMERTWLELWKRGLIEVAA